MRVCVYYITVLQQHPHCKMQRNVRQTFWKSSIHQENEETIPGVMKRSCRAVPQGWFLLLRAHRDINVSSVSTRGQCHMNETRIYGNVIEEQGKKKDSRGFRVGIIKSNTTWEGLLFSEKNHCVINYKLFLASEFKQFTLSCVQIHISYIPKTIGL